ncbi:MAG: nitrogenase component 1 [Coriobacteriia bacterium]|nr:nitrogenase component 1 [Coriobacteriia bacterium]
MRGLFYQLSPFTPDTVAAASFFTDTNALVITVDMNGTISTYRGRVGVRQESPVTVCSVLDNREISYVMGEDSSFAQECLDLMADFDHDYTVLLHGPVSSMVGIDLASLADELQEREGKPVVAVECTGSGTYEQGLAAAATTVLKRVRALPAEPQPGAYNILGVNAVDHNVFSLRDLLIERIQDKMGQPTLSVWGCYDVWEDWEQARFASENIVASVSALPLAKAMKRAWGIPWRRVDELGLLDDRALEPAAAPRKVLVVGETLLGTLVRQLLEPAGHQVTLATFFTLPSNMARMEDRRLTCEFDLRDLAREQDFDLVVCDDQLRCCWRPDQAFYCLPHSAVAQSADQFHEPTPLGDQWITGLRDALADISSPSEEEGA